MEATVASCLNQNHASGWRAQFGKPAGRLGWLIGHLMAAKNRARGAWVLDLLALKPPDRVLEVGFGPGADIFRASRLAWQGLVAGIDHSEVMLRQATRRNAEAIHAGRVELRLAAMPRVPWADGSFDCVYSINCVQFWPDKAAGFAEVRRLLRGGRSDGDRAPTAPPGSDRGGCAQGGR